MIELFMEPLFGLILSISMGLFFWWIKGHHKFRWINPLLFSVVSIILILQTVHIPYEIYKKGADIIHLFLGPITVILAVPLYEQRAQLIKHKVAIFSGTVLGSLSALSAVYILGSSFGLSELFIHSLMPKSTTTPIGISASQMLDGIIGLTVFSIVITGIFGSLIAPIIFKLLGIKTDIAKGIALGTTSHAIGTAKAYEISPLSGAMSGLSIALAGIVSVVWIVLYTLL